MTVSLTKINAAQLSDFLAGGANHLYNNREMVNALNVFPVPDGDTGINMHLTVNSAVKNIASKEIKDITTLMADFSMGSLMGARGNSGVILSQIFRGIAQGLSGKDEISGADLAAAFQNGSRLSYKSVMKPVEGTILTVFKDFAAGAQKAAQGEDDIIKILEAALTAGEKSLQNTPNLLPVLKDAGVVDAGGKGMLLIMEGGFKALKGEYIAAEEQAEPLEVVQQKANIKKQDLEFAFCTQFLIKGKKIPQDAIRRYLSHTPPGDSLLVVGTDEVVKIHFHNNQPWKVMEYAAQFGTIHDIEIDNMNDQQNHNSTAESLSKQDVDVLTGEKPQEQAVDSIAKPTDGADNTCQTAVIAICSGEGMRELYESMGAYVIEGGQTMNPSAEELLTAIKNCGGKEVIVLPNNSNIILAAEQAVKLSDIPAFVVPSKFVTQGISLMLNFNRDICACDMLPHMLDSLEASLPLEITYAVRKSKFNGFKIEANDILGLNKGEIVTVKKDLQVAVEDIIANAVAENDDFGLISLFYGNDLEEDKAQAIADALSEKYPLYDIDLHFGGQPLYYFLISLE